MDKELWKDILTLSVQAYKSLLEDGNQRVVEIKKGDFYARYQTPQQALDAISMIEEKIKQIEKEELFDKHGCEIHTLCRGI
jgi:hypothetical protein